MPTITTSIKRIIVDLAHKHTEPTKAKVNKTQVITYQLPTFDLNTFPISQIYEFKLYICSQYRKTYGTNYPTPLREWITTF